MSIFQDGVVSMVSLVLKHLCIYGYYHRTDNSAALGAYSFPTMPVNVDLLPFSLLILVNV